eukprot:11201158-Lingulodinium_polyedra.AAC.1
MFSNRARAFTHPSYGLRRARLPNVAARSAGGGHRSRIRAYQGGGRRSHVCTLPTVWLVAQDASCSAL